MELGFPKEYEQISRLGEGGMGTVFLARQKAFDRLVAIKVLKPDLASQVGDRKRFLREAKFCARVEDPNILGIIDSGISEGIPYIVMEYVDGPSLRDLLCQGLDQKQGLDIIRQVSSALMAAHKNQIVHRDLKPENVLITKNGDVRVADWGISRALMDVEQLTKTGIVLGTPQYMAPEQILAKELGPPCDMYSLGVMFFQVLTGRLPFEQEALSDLLQAHLKTPPPKVHELAPNVPRYLPKLVTQLLDKEPTKRPSAKEVVEILSNEGPSASDELKIQTMACDVPTLETKVAPAQSKGSKLVFVALLLVLVTLFIVHSNDGEHQVSENIPFELKRVTLKDPRHLSLHYRGNSQKSYKLTIIPDCAPTFEARVDFSKESQTVGGSNTLLVELEQPLIGNGTIHFTPKDLEKRFVSAEPLFKEALEPISSLKGKRLDKFLTAMSRKRQKLRAYMRDLSEMKDREKAERTWLEGHDKISPQYEQMLADFNMTKESMAKLKELLAKCDGAQLYGGNELERRLVPLRMAESLLSYGGLVTFPWGKSLPICSYKIKEEEECKTILSNMLLLDDHDLISMVSQKGGQQRKDYQWVADKNFFSKFKKQAVASLAYAALANDTQQNQFIRSILRLNDDEKFPEIDEIKYEYPSELDIGKNVKQWPPKELWLLVVTRGLSREMDFIIELNENFSCSVMYITDGFNPFELKTLKYQHILLRLSPKALKQGKNKLRIWTKSYPKLDARSVIALLRIAVFGQF